jgi:poly(A) polymerase
MRVVAGSDEEVRIVGGAVRDALLGRPLTDIDLATTATPDIVTARAEAVGFRAVPTGIAHGTVTIVAGGKPYEITTLREDVETNGRHATVTFGRDWAKDAARRDFTVNALCADVDGWVTDTVGGIADCAARHIRFIGRAEARIREDYLRILRFYRFCAVINVTDFDADAIRATQALASGIDTLSGERVGQEMQKLVVADGAVSALAAMRDHGILSHAIGLDTTDLTAFSRLKARMAALSERGLEPPAHRATLFLAALVATEPAALALVSRLRMANAARDRMIAALRARDRLATDPRTAAIPGHVYRLGTSATVDGMLLSPGDDADVLARIKAARDFTPPRLPINGRDLVAAGVEPGPAVGAAIEKLTDRWIKSGFTLTREALLATLK